MKTPESAVLRACLDYLRLRGHFVFRVNNGACKTERGRFLRFTDKLGVPDIIGILPDGRFLGVECKSKTGKQTDWQRIFEKDTTERGGVYVLARGVEDLQANGL